MKSTKKSLILAIFSTFLCVVMLAGMTFAWFTDTVASGKNKIVSGNLDVEFEYSKDMSDWKTVKDTTDLFSDVALWEPGAVSTVYFRIANEGSLAIKYNVSIMVDNETEGTNVNDEAFKLSDYIRFGTVDGVTAKYDTREAAIEAVSEDAKTISEGFGFAGTMKANDPEKVFALVVYMPETLGNEANYKTGTTAPSIEIGAVLNAAQLSFETDSFDDTYDAPVTWLGGIDEVPAAVDNVITIETAEQLAGLAKAVNSGTTYEGITVKLNNDLDLGNVAWTPIGNVVSYPSNTFAGTFDGQGHTISNLKCVDKTPMYATAGLFGSSKGVIKNINVENVDIMSTHYAGAIVGYASENDFGIDNCHVKGGTITSVPELVETEYDNGDKVGGINGYSVSGSEITNCSVENLVIKAHRDIGGIAGATAGTVSNNTVTDCTIIQSNVNAYKTGVDTYHEIIGRDLGATVSGNTFTNVIFANEIEDGLCIDGSVYTVSNANGLLKFNEIYNTTSVGAVSLELCANIDMTGKTWTPISSEVAGETTLSNKITEINGNGFTISNLTIAGEHSGNKNANGIIVNVANDLLVQNLTISAPKMNTAKSNVGIIVGQITGGTTTFDNVKVTDADITAGKKIGTLVGIVNDEVLATNEKVVIKNCIVTGTKIDNTNEEDCYTGTLVGWVADTLYGAQIEISGTNTVETADVTYPDTCTSIYNAKYYLRSYGPYVCVDDLK